MPTRLLREGIISSERVDQLDPPAEVFYRRLMSKVDDHGLYDSRPSMLRSSLYPLRVDKVRETDIHRWIAACEKAGLIVLYAKGGASSPRWITAAEIAPGVKAGLAVSEKPYLMMLDTGWEKRSKPKYPLPPENSCKQPETVVPVVGVVVGVESVVVGEGPRRRGTPAPKRKAKTAMPEGFGVSERVMRWAAEKQHGRLEQHLEAFKRKVRQHDYRYVDWDEAFMGAIADNWAKLPAVNGHSHHGREWFVAGWSQIVAKGAELGLEQERDEGDGAYRARVFAAAGVTEDMVRAAEKRAA